MGNHRFKLSNMIPNAWFYKLKDMSKTTTNHHNKPPSASYHSSSTTTAQPPDLSQFHNSPKFPHFHDPTRKSSKRSTPNRKTIYKPSPKHTESTHIIQEFLHSPETTQYPSSESTQSRLSSSISDFIIDVKGTKKIDLYPEIELQPPPIITKPANRTSRNRRYITFRQESQRKQPNSEGGTSETRTWDDFPTVVGNLLVKSTVGNLPQMRISTHKNPTAVCDSNPSVTTITDLPMNMGPSLQLAAGDPSVTSVSNLSQMRLPTDKNPTHFFVGNPSVTSIIDKLPTDIAVNDTPLFCSASPSGKKAKEINQIPARKSISGVKLRSNSPKLGMTKRIGHKSFQNKNLSKSFAVVKSSFNPTKDFMQSMMEMITENKMTSSNDLEELLACYLALNSDEYHDVIVKAFEQIWFSLPDV
ncbi:putative transcription factor OFP family [Helianthus annuus]|uniref:Transcription repressor n=1 Tax=Helianthus annuus TaxID=4232 RepID=A0A251UZ89_HELAN|nr:transcription repressor OFP3 [Helianthus annuus]KAF5809649.1 putative transcription factor OFP family [Helianthus annuus]KAJ0580627.1 putative transcription factor OFP family [Helianthus annuus]KAJ0588252.1 putative transcription factor OFP family [Helianthus annuus]KAJ0596581.1 putative transcription factor OFP family [Helianthus annuus]KAJ0757243.1 putative transcription factor OFP family [Helianthus annuus]